MVGTPSPQRQAVTCPQEQGVGVLDSQGQVALKWHQHPRGKWNPTPPNTRIWCHQHSSPGTRPSHCWGRGRPHRRANGKFQRQISTQPRITPLHLRRSTHRKRHTKLINYKKRRINSNHHLKGAPKRDLREYRKLVK